MVYIKSLLPNPVGRDSGSEWIRISNSGDQSVSLVGWRIQDEKGDAYTLTGLGEIGAGETIELKDSATKINLKNTGDTIFLYDERGALMDEFAYSGPAEEGQIFLAQPIKTEDTSLPLKSSANILDSRGLIEKPINTNFYEPLITGIFISLLSTLVFIYLWVNVFSDKNDD